jgi:hypothetical protein
MVIKSNKGFCTLVLLDVLSILGWVVISPSDLICDGGISLFSDSMISSSHIGSRPLGSPQLSIELSMGILVISTRSGSFFN